jgi:branched-chain amino acid transport system permease protein
MTSSSKNFLIWGIIFALLMALPLMIEKTNVLNFLFLIFLFITLSQSWNILGGYTGQVNLGHAAFFGIGALITRHFWFMGISFFITLLMGGIAALIFALIIGFPAFRLKGAYFVIGMLAMAEIVRIIVGNALPFISTMPTTHIAVYSLIPRYYLALIITTAVVTSVYILNNSKPGLAMVAIREDEDTAEAAGVNALKYKLIALGMSSFIAGLCGGLFAFFHVSYYPAHPFSVHWTFDALFIAYIGGIGTVIGPIVGTLFYIGLREIFPFVLPQDIHTIVFGVLFILVILLMPRGLVDMPKRYRRLINYFKELRNSEDKHKVAKKIKLS